MALLKTKEADFLVQNKALYEDNDHLSQIQDYDNVPNSKDQDGSRKQRVQHAVVGLSIENMSSEMASNSIAASSQDVYILFYLFQDGLSDLHDLESSLVSFPIKPLQALKGCSDIDEDEGVNGPDWKGVMPLESDTRSSRPMDQDAGRHDGENSGQSDSFTSQVVPELRKYLSGSIIHDNAFSPNKITGDVDM
ncbi:hypothetical protein V6N13_028337 [Hibiscus sabdariffa]